MLLQQWMLLGRWMFLQQWMFLGQWMLLGQWIFPDTCHPYVINYKLCKYNPALQPKEQPAQAHPTPTPKNFCIKHII
jgi:hypothetical protein